MEATVESTAQANGAEPQAPATQAVDPRDYLARASSDPEFAVAEIRKHQSEAAKARAELKQLAPLKDIVTRLDGGAATAAQLIYEQAAILQHPEVRSIVEHYRKTGTLPTSTPSRQDASDDEYQDPVDMLKSEVTQLREQLALVQGHVQRDRTMITHTTTQSHLQRLAEKHKDIWEVIQPAILERAEEWEKTPQGRDVLSQATFDTWDNLAKMAIGDHLDAVMSKRAEQRSQSKAGLGTEPRPNTVTTGREDPIRQSEVWKPGTARKFMQDIWRREGRSV
jgi:hypothetical protein